jgi:hypothetical protein
VVPWSIAAAYFAIKHSPRFQICRVSCVDQPG